MVSPDRDNRKTHPEHSLALDSLVASMLTRSTPMPQQTARATQVTMPPQR